MTRANDINCSQLSLGLIRYSGHRYLGSNILCHFFIKFTIKCTVSVFFLSFLINNFCWFVKFDTLRDRLRMRPFDSLWKKRSYNVANLFITRLSSADVWFECLMRWNIAPLILIPSWILRCNFDTRLPRYIFQIIITQILFLFHSVFNETYHKRHWWEINVTCFIFHPPKI